MTKIGVEEGGWDYEGLRSVPAIAFQSLADRCSAGINPPQTSSCCSLLALWFCFGLLNLPGFI